MDDIKSRLDILDVVSQYTSLQSSGRSYRALCPFHSEKTPSFYVFPERQSWRCFGACATGGDMFSFVMRMDNLGFSETLRRLAQQAGVDLADKRVGRAGGDVLYQINEAARDYFSQMLESPGRGSDARAYLKRRGLSPQTIEKFQLGLSPGDGESLGHYLASNGFGRDQLALTGVITDSQAGGYRDLFRNRLMFPIRDGEGRLAGFGGRALDDSNPKYLNIPRSPVFDKGSILYGLYLAREGAQGQGIVVVEGYMDAIAGHQHGFSNTVASMGTALTQQQVSLLSSFVRRTASPGRAEVVLALDPDTAGQEATLRSLESSWKVFQAQPMARTQGVTLYQRPVAPSLKVAALPGGKDPDEIILESPEEWRRVVDSAMPLLDFLFAALAMRLDLATPEGKSRLAGLLFPLIAATPDPFQQDHYFQRLADQLGVGEATLRASLGRLGQASNPTRGRAAGPSRRGTNAPPRGTVRDQGVAATPFAGLDHDPLEERCLALMLQGDRSDENEEGPGELRSEYFRRMDNREIFTNWAKCSTLEALKDNLDYELAEHLEYLLDKSAPPSDRKQREVELRGCLRRLEERYLRELKQEEELRDSQAVAEETEEQQILWINERLRDIFRG